MYVSQLDHMCRLQRLLSIVVIRGAVCLIRRQVVVVLYLNRRCGLRVVRGVLLVLRRVWSRHSRIVHGWVVSCSVSASLSLLLCAMIANC